MKGTLKRGILILLFLVILSFSVNASANFSSQSGYDWLSTQISADGSFNSDTFSTAVAVLALDNAGYDTSLSESWLVSQMDETSSCIPSSSCSTKDTAAAVIAYNELQDETYFDLWDSWFLSSLDDSDSAGNWYLEVVTSSTGTCTVSYTLDEEAKEFEIEVEEGSFPSCDDSNFLDLDECVQKNLITTNPGITIDVDCSSLDGSVVLSLIYKSDSTYYIIANENSDTADFQVNNGCFGKASGSSCNQEASLWAGLALNTITSDINTLIYLKETYDSSNAEEAALLYLTTADDTYLEDIIGLQKSDGSFDRNVFTTGLAILALSDSTEYSEEIENAKSFLRDEQSEDGHWVENIEDTAMALYGAFGDDDVTITEYEISDIEADEEEVETVVSSGTCTTDDDCDSGEVCIDDACIESECNYDTTCEYPEWDENANNCPSDCSCGDGVCDDYESDYDTCSDDCGGEEEVEEEEEEETETVETTYVYEEEDEGGSGFLLLILFILILGGLGGGGYFAYSKGYLDEIISKIKGGGKAPVSPGSPQQPYKPFTSKVQPQQRPMPPQQPGMRR